MDEKTLTEKLKFIENYQGASNAATGSKFDSNANVTQKNLSTLTCELGKKDIIDIRRAIMDRYLTITYDEETAKAYKEDLKNHIIYQHDETSLMPYCCSISLYPFVLSGLKPLGGTSCEPKHADSFIGGVINLVYIVASQFAGAVAIPEFLTYFDHFIRIDYGDDYIDHLDDALEIWGNRKTTLRDKIEDWFQQFVHSVNEPAGARNFQSPFTNIAYFDKYYFASIFKNFVFPDGDEPKWETTKELQKMFMKWFNKERLIEILTFPVETANILVENGKYKDEEMADFFAEMWSEGHSFFMYQSDSVDALASCCFAGDELIRVINNNTLDGTIISIKNFCEEHKDDFGNYTTMSYNPETGKQELTRITGILKKISEYPMLVKIEIGNAVLRVTPEHVFFVKDNETGSFVEIEAKEFVGNARRYSFVNANNEELHANSVLTELFSGNVYDIELEKNHLFYANDIVTHNCRLRNEVESNVFSYTLGAGGIETGSKCVITINVNRIVQNWYKQLSETGIDLPEYITPIIKRVHKYLSAWNNKLWDDFNVGMLPIYKAGFIDLDKQFLTTGLSGWVEAAEFLATVDTKYSGIDIDPDNDQYKMLAKDVLGTIKRINKEDRTEHTRWNCEYVPGENLGVKFYNWDKEDGYVVPSSRNLYNSYFFRVEDQKANPVKKFYYQGNGFATECDGGVALHNNLSEHLTKQQYRKLMDVAVDAGCNYFTYNIPNTICNDCGHIDKRFLHKCPKCGSENIDYATRIIGYLKRISNFSEARQEEAGRRYYGSVDSND